MSGGITPNQAADFLGRLKTANGEKIIAKELSFEVLTGELFRRLNATEFSEAKEISGIIANSDSQVKTLPIPDWVKQNVTLFHWCLRKFLSGKSHANQHAAPAKKEMPAVALKLVEDDAAPDTDTETTLPTGQPPDEEQRGQAESPTA